jgi:hypothetical protein
MSSNPFLDVPAQRQHGSITLNIAGILTQRAWVQVLMREPDPPKHAAPERGKQRVSQGLDHLRALWVAAGNKLGTALDLR